MNHPAVVELQLGLGFLAQVDHPLEHHRQALGLRFIVEFQILRPHVFVGEDLVHLTHEAHHEGRRRLVVDLGGAADLLDPTLVHHHDPVRHLHRLLLVVGDDHRGDARLLLQVAQPHPQLLAHLGIESAERFIEQQHLGLHRQRPRQRHPLPLAAGELKGIAARVALQLHQLQQLLHPVANPGRAPAAQAQAEGDVLPHRQMLEQGEVLEHKAHMPLLHREGGGIGAVEVHPTLVHRLQAGHHPQQGALAAAGRPQQGHQRSGLDIEAEVVDGPEIAEAARDIADANPHGSTNTVPTLQAGAGWRRGGGQRVLLPGLHQAAWLSLAASRRIRQSLRA